MVVALTVDGGERDDDLGWDIRPRILGRSSSLRNGFAVIAEEAPTGPYEARPDDKLRAVSKDEFGARVTVEDSWFETREVALLTLRHYLKSCR
jgi:hypothetical protein